MMPTERFERQLPELLTELAAPRTPDYFDDLLGLTARTRQRPAWTLLERWIPMDVAQRPVLVRQVPVRQIAVLVLIALLLAASLVIAIGSQRRPAPPFGPAANGIVAYASDGDIYTADPVTGTATAVMTGPETDLRPQFSLDGTRFAFERKVSGASGPGQVYVAKPDGTELTLLTPEPISTIASYAFSPDGRELLISTNSGSASAMLIAKSDGSGIRSLAVGDLVAKDPEYRPPNGAEIVFVGTAARSTAAGQYVAGLYAVKPDGSDLRTIVAPTNLQMFGPRSKPDGTQIAFNALGLDPNPEPPGLASTSSTRMAVRLGSCETLRARTTSSRSSPGRTMARACSSPAAIGRNLAWRTALRRWRYCRSTGVVPSSGSLDGRIPSGRRDQPRMGARRQRDHHDSAECPGNSDGGCPLVGRRHGSIASGAVVRCRSILLATRR